MTMPCAVSAVPLDHVMFYGGFAMEKLFDFFERAGFFLTPLSQHSHGSVNRLAMLEGQYIELIGFKPGTPPTVRPEIQAMPLGLNGLAASDRPDYPRAHRGRFSRPMALERPIDTPTTHGIARFTITHAEHPANDARAFLCRHHTPELLWVKEWIQHRNTAVSIIEVGVPTEEPDRFATIMDAVFDVPPKPQRNCWTSGDSTMRIVPAGGRAYLAVQVQDLHAALRSVREGGLPHALAGNELRIRLPNEYASNLILRAA